MEDSERVQSFFSRIINGKAIGVSVASKNALSSRFFSIMTPSLLLGVSKTIVDRPHDSPLPALRVTVNNKPSVMRHISDVYYSLKEITEQAEHLLLTESMRVMVCDAVTTSNSLHSDTISLSKALKEKAEIVDLDFLLSRHLYGYTGSHNTSHLSARLVDRIKVVAESASSMNDKARAQERDEVGTERFQQADSLYVPINRWGPYLTAHVSEVSAFIDSEIELEVESELSSDIDYLISAICVKDGEKVTSIDALDVEQDSHDEIGADDEVSFQVDHSAVNTLESDDFIPIDYAFSPSELEQFSADYALHLLDTTEQDWLSVDEHSEIEKDAHDFLPISLPEVALIEEPHLQIESKNSLKKKQALLAPRPFSPEQAAKTLLIHGYQTTMLFHAINEMQEKGSKGSLQGRGLSAIQLFLAKSKTFEFDQLMSSAFKMAEPMGVTLSTQHAIRKALRQEGDVLTSIANPAASMKERVAKLMQAT